jgi:hypothetical protein
MQRGWPMAPNYQSILALMNLMLIACPQRLRGGWAATPRSGFSVQSSPFRVYFNLENLGKVTLDPSTPNP